MCNMNKTTLAFLLSPIMFLAGSLLSQVEPAGGRPEFDHNAIHVRDLRQSVEFYEKVMKLQRIPAPFKDDQHVWFRSGPHQQLHVVGGATEKAPHVITDHFAFRVASI